MTHRTNKTVKRGATATVIALAVVLASSLLSACDVSNRTTATGSSASPSQAPQLLEQLNAAYTELGTSTIHIAYDLSSDSTKTWFMYAFYDAEAKNIRVLTSGLNPDVELRLIGPDLYVKWPGLSKRPWMHLDRGKLPSTGATRRALAVFAFARPLAGVESAVGDDRGGMNGLLNLDKATASVSDRGEQYVLDDLARRAGDAASKVKFWAALTKSGQLLNLTYTVGQGHDLMKIFATFNDSDQGSNLTTTPDPNATEEATTATIGKL